MLTMGVFDGIKKIFNDIGKFFEKNYSEPFFWIIIFVALLAISLYVISELADK